MSGCFMFIRSLTGGRRRSRSGAPSPRSSLGAASSLECGLSCPLAGGAAHLSCCPSHVVHGGGLGGMDVVCSPASSSDGSPGGYSTCSSSAGMGASLYGSSSSLASGAAGSGGMPSPTGHLCCSPGTEERQAAALHAACEVVLMEHQLDTQEWCLFVHKRLRPIRTRPDGARAARAAALLAATAVAVGSPAGCNMPPAHFAPRLRRASCPPLQQTRRRSPRSLASCAS